MLRQHKSRTNKRNNDGLKYRHMKPEVELTFWPLLHNRTTGCDLTDYSRFKFLLEVYVDHVTHRPPIDVIFSSFDSARRGLHS